MGGGDTRNASRTPDLCKISAGPEFRRRRTVIATLRDVIGLVTQGAPSRSSGLAPSRHISARKGYGRSAGALLQLGRVKEKPRMSQGG
jgi:hypothetical protein